MTGSRWRPGQLSSVCLSPSLSLSIWSQPLSSGKGPELPSGLGVLAARGPLSPRAREVLACCPQRFLLRLRRGDGTVCGEAAGLAHPHWALSWPWCGARTQVLRGSECERSLSRVCAGGRRHPWSEGHQRREGECPSAPGGPTWPPARSPGVRSPAPAGVLESRSLRLPHRAGLCPWDLGPCSSSASPVGRTRLPTPWPMPILSERRRRRSRPFLSGTRSSRSASDVPHRFHRRLQRARRSAERPGTQAGHTGRAGAAPAQWGQLPASSRAELSRCRR